VIARRQVAMKGRRHARRGPAPAAPSEGARRRGQPGLEEGAAGRDQEGGRELPDLGGGAGDALFEEAVAALGLQRRVRLRLRVDQGQPAPGEDQGRLGAQAQGAQRGGTERAQVGQRPACLAVGEGDERAEVLPGSEAGEGCADLARALALVADDRGEQGVEGAAVLQEAQPDRGRGGAREAGVLLRGAEGAAARAQVREGAGPRGGVADAADQPWGEFEAERAQVAGAAQRTLQIEERAAALRDGGEWAGGAGLLQEQEQGLLRGGGLLAQGRRRLLQRRGQGHQRRGVLVDLGRQGVEVMGQGGAVPISTVRDTIAEGMRSERFEPGGTAKGQMLTAC
jgi:hypothetical protein